MLLIQVFVSDNLFKENYHLLGWVIYILVFCRIKHETIWFFHQIWLWQLCSEASDVQKLPDQ